jgi:hypothetical protein
MKLYKYIIWINLFLITLLAVDFFILPTAPIKEQVKTETLERSRTSPTHSYMSYSVLTTAGHKYIFPSELSGWLEQDEIFTVNKTELLRRPSSVEFKYDESIYTMDVGYFNSNVIVQIIVLAVLGLSIFGLFKRQSGKNFRLNLLLMSIFFYAGFVIILIID